MKKPNHCGCCGKPIKGKQYNPYNVTFGHYECGVDEKKMCLKCAEAFVAEGNKCKGGIWKLKEIDK